MSFVSSDIIHDIFLFLDRNEIEKNQLVSKHWNATVNLYNFTLPLRRLKELKILGKAWQNLYAEVDGHYVIDEQKNIDKKRVESLRFCVIEEIRFDESEFSIDHYDIQTIIKTLFFTNGIKFRILSLYSNCHRKSEYIIIFDFIQKYIDVDQLYISSTSNFINLYYSIHNVVYAKSQVYHILSIPSSVKKIYLIHKQGHFDNNVAPIYFQSCLKGDDRFRVVFGRHETTYVKKFCINVIEHYLEFQEPEKLINKVVFENFEKNVPINDNPGITVGHRLLREWLKNESQHNEIVEKENPGKSLYEKEIFDLKSNRGEPTKSRPLSS